MNWKDVDIICDCIFQICGVYFVCRQLSQAVDRQNWWKFWALMSFAFLAATAGTIELLKI